MGFMVRIHSFLAVGFKVRVDSFLVLGFRDSIYSFLAVGISARCKCWGAGLEIESIRTQLCATDAGCLRMKYQSLAG